LGDGTQVDRRVAVQVLGLAGVTAVAAGAAHSVALQSDGTVWAWGDNSAGQLGTVGPRPRTQPVRVRGLHDVTAIASGVGYHTLALDKDGGVWTWGANQLGQLGNGTVCSPVPCGSPVPTRVSLASK